MDSVLHAAAMYLFLFVVFRLAGRRTLSEMTSFDFILVLILSEMTQEALIHDDHSMTNAFLLVLTMVGIDVFLSWIKTRSLGVEKVLEGVPLVLVDHGRPLAARLRSARVSVDDVMEAARHLHGIERLDQVKYAVLESNGGISIIPQEA